MPVDSEDKLVAELKAALRESRAAFARKSLDEAKLIASAAYDKAESAGLVHEAEVLKAQLLICDKKWDEAMKLPWGAVGVDFSMRGQAWDRLGFVYSNKKVYDKAIECYKKALDDKTYDTPGYAWNNMGAVYAKKKDYDKAIECYMKALDDKTYDTPADAWHNMGVAYFNKKDTDKAIECYMKALDDKTYDTPGMTWHNMGVAYAEKKDYDKAIECYMKALDDKTYDTPGYAWNNMGIAYAEKKDHDKAIECYMKALDDKTYDTPGMTWNNMGIAYAEKKNYDKAIECYMKALDDKTYDTPGKAWHNMGVAYFNKKDTDRAIECYIKALDDKTYATPGDTWNNMGVAYAEKKNYDKAIECYMKALDDKTYATPGVAWHNMGVAYFDKKDYDKAIDARQRAAQAYAKSGDAASATREKEMAALLKRSARAARDGLDKVAQEFKSAASALGAAEKRGAAAGAPFLKRLIKRASAETTAYRSYAALPASKLDDVLVVLKGWSSSTPIIGEASPDVFGGSQCRGGGYLIKSGGRGVALDPGYDYLRNLRSENFHIKEINAVIVTHNHPDHQDDLCRIANLDYDYRDNTPNSPKLSSIKYFLDQDTERARESTLAGLSADENLIQQVVPANPDWHICEGVDLHAFKTVHGDGRIVKAPFGLVLSLRVKGGAVRRVGYTSDTSYTDDLVRELDGCDVVVCHFSSARVDEFDDPEKLHNNHLGFNGLRKLLSKVGAKLFVVSEFWGGVGDQRHDLVEFLKLEQAKQNRAVRILAGDIGLSIDLRTLDVFCSGCGHARSYEDVRTVEPTDPYDRLRYFCTDCPTTPPGTTQRRAYPTRDES